MNSPFLLSPILAVLALSPALGFAAGEKPGPVSYVTVETRDMKVEFAGDRAWTFSGITHKGAPITGRPGFCGTVFSAEGQRWIGTGHNEGGIEKIAEVVLTVDGKPCALVDKAVYRGGQAELRKRSMLGPIKLEAVYTITADRIIEEHRYEVTEDVNVGVLYGFMHPFVPSTTAWMAEKTDGTLVEGSFSSENGHSLQEDVKWTAIHDPKSQRATLVWYPQPLVGQGMKTFYWDKKIYHKLYNHLYSHAVLRQGTKFEAKVMLRWIETDITAWKEKIKVLTAETSAEKP